MYRLVITAVLGACIYVLGGVIAYTIQDTWTYQALGEIDLEARLSMDVHNRKLQQDIREIEQDIMQMREKLAAHEPQIVDTVPVVKELPPFLQSASTTRVLLWRYGQAKYNNSLSWKEAQEIENNSELAHPYLVLGLSETGREAGIDMVYLPRIQHAQMCEAIFGAMGLQKRKRI